jgi:hypothetical protein
VYGVSSIETSLHFVLTIVELERLYIWRRSELLTELLSESVSAEVADEALQHAFAVVAKQRFGVRSEHAALELIRNEALRGIREHGSSHFVADGRASDWADVLLRSNISIGRATPSTTLDDGAVASPRRGMWKVRLRVARAWTLTVAVLRL